MSRRHFLRGAGMALALPLLDIVHVAVRARRRRAVTPRRFFAVNNNLGLLEWAVFPQGGGPRLHGVALLGYSRNIATTSRCSAGSRTQCRWWSPLGISFLTGAPHPGSGSFRNRISLDQFIAERIGIQTRFPSLTLSVNLAVPQPFRVPGTGVAMPPEGQSLRGFQADVCARHAGEIERQVREISTGKP